MGSWGWVTGEAPGSALLMALVGKYSPQPEFKGGEEHHRVTLNTWSLAKMCHSVGKLVINCLFNLPPTPAPPLPKLYPCSGCWLLLTCKGVFTLGLC